LRAFTDLFVGALSTGNPLRVQTTYIRRQHAQVKKEPAREVKDSGNTLLVFPDISYLFPHKQKTEGEILNIKAKILQNQIIKFTITENFVTMRKIDKN